VARCQAAQGLPVGLPRPLTVGHTPAQGVSGGGRWTRRGYPQRGSACGRARSRLSTLGGMVTRSVLTRVAVSLAAAGLLAGCGGSDTPPGAGAPTGTTSPTGASAPTSTAPTPTASSVKPTTPASTTTTTPTAAPLPPAAKAHSKAGAEAFVRAYFAEVNRAWTTPSTTQLSHYASVGCKSCAALLKTATTLEMKKQHYSGDPVSLRTVSAATEAGTGRYQVSVSAIQERRDVVDSDGDVVLSDSRKTLGFLIALDWRNNRWSIDTIRRSA
jgi:hypothetical protein